MTTIGKLQIVSTGICCATSVDCSVPFEILVTAPNVTPRTLFRRCVRWRYAVERIDSLSLVSTLLVLVIETRFWQSLRSRSDDRSYGTDMNKGRSVLLTDLPIVNRSRPWWDLDWDVSGYKIDRSRLTECRSLYDLGYLCYETGLLCLRLCADRSHLTDAERLPI